MVAAHPTTRERDKREGVGEERDGEVGCFCKFNLNSVILAQPGRHLEVSW